MTEPNSETTTTKPKRTTKPKVAESTEVAVFEKPRLPWHDAIGQRFRGLGVDKGTWRVLCEAIFPNAKTPDAIVMALSYCKARKLDVFKKPVNIVPMWNSALGKNVETVWPSINEVEITAARTGQWAGMEPPKWGTDRTSTLKGFKWVSDKREADQVTVTHPEFCSVTVHRLVDGKPYAFTEQVFWLEAYARAGGKGSDLPTDMWVKRPRGQLHKVAKAAALRAAFPESGEYTADEMEGREITDVATQPTERRPERSEFTEQVNHKFAVIDLDHTEHLFGVEAFEAAATFMLEVLTEASRRGSEQLDAMWEANAVFVGALRTENHTALADSIHGAFTAASKRLNTKQANGHVQPQDSRPSPENAHPPTETLSKPESEAAPATQAAPKAEAPQATPAALQEKQKRTPVLSPFDPKAKSRNDQAWIMWAAWFRGEAKDADPATAQQMAKTFDKELTYLRAYLPAEWDAIAAILDQKRVD